MRKTTVAAAILLFASPSFAAENVTISTAATSGGTLSGGVFTATADDANLNITDLKTALAASNVTVNTGTTGSQNGDITLANKMFWPANTLYLMSNRSINVNAKLSATGTSGLQLRTPHGGTLNFGSAGKITFANTSQSFMIGTTSYALVADISTLAIDVSGNPTGDFALINNFDATGHTYGSAPVSAEFIGDFQALGNTISNLTITDSGPNQHDALFAWLGPNGSVENLQLTNVQVKNTSSASEVAGVAVENQGTISGVSVTGHASLSGTGVAAGLVSLNESAGSITNSSSSVSVTASSKGISAGGLVGINAGAIFGSSSTGAVSDTAGDTAGPTIGGLTASNSGTIALSFATGNATGGASSVVGGLVGNNNGGNINQAYATGDVMAGNSSSVGGLVGTTSQGPASNLITDCYATGSETGLSGALAGGFVGVNDNTSIATSYSIGTPAATGANPTIGGFVGEDGSSGGLSNTYWSTTSSGITDPSRGAGVPSNDPGITGLTNTQFRSGLPTGFNSAIWGETTGVNFGLPYLLALPPS
jgi:hypothetical protein